MLQFYYWNVEVLTVCRQTRQVSLRCSLFSPKFFKSQIFSSLARVQCIWLINPAKSIFVVLGTQLFFFFVLFVKISFFLCFRFFCSVWYDSPKVAYFQWDNRSVLVWYWFSIVSYKTFSGYSEKYTLKQTHSYNIQHSLEMDNTTRIKPLCVWWATYWLETINHWQSLFRINTEYFIVCLHLISLAEEKPQSDLFFFFFFFAFFCLDQNIVIYKRLFLHWKKMNRNVQNSSNALSTKTLCCWCCQTKNKNQNEEKTIASKNHVQ